MIKYKILPKTTNAECLILPILEDESFSKLIKEFDGRFNGLISKIKKSKDFEGKKTQTVLVYTQDKNIPRVFLSGLGKRKKLDIKIWKRAVGSAVMAVQEKKIEDLAFVVPAAVLKKFGAKKIGLETVAAIELANYAFDKHKSDKDVKVRSVKSIVFAAEFSSADLRGFRKGIDEGVIIGESVNYARGLGNMPPSVMTPALLAREAVKLGRRHKKIKVKILSRPEIKKLGMGCLLGVSSGSGKEPKFIIAEYKGGAKDARPIILIGKGITFDSGGLHIKPDQYMTEMKFDMLGAATVLGAFKAAAELGLRKNLVVLIPACENMPDGNSFRPDDILKAMNGKTVEIINTDAEGRLILADALSYAAIKYKPKEVIDVATLTGACMVALGLEYSGLFSADEKMAGKILKSAEESGENLWRLPFGEEYAEQMKSEVADIKNLGDRYGGASSAAEFLRFFTLSKKGKPDYAWAHIDLSSSYIKGKGKPWIRGGANGFGVQTLVNYLSL